MHLDKTSIKILRYIKDNAPASNKAISAFIGDKALTDNCVSSLITKKLIIGLLPVTSHTPNGFKSATTSPYVITADGLAYLEELDNEQPQTTRGKIAKWFKNNALEIIAIIISIIALLKP